MSAKKVKKETEFRCICGAKVLPNDATAVMILNRKNSIFTKQHILCEKCSYGLLEWLSLRSYVNKRINLDDYFYELKEDSRTRSESSRIESSISSINSLLESINALNNSHLPLE